MHTVHLKSRNIVSFNNDKDNKQDKIGDDS